MGTQEVLLLQTTLFTAPALPKWTQEELQKTGPGLYFKPSNYRCSRQGFYVKKDTQPMSVNQKVPPLKSEGGLVCQGTRAKFNIVVS